MGQGASESIQFPDDESVTGQECLEKLVELRAVGQGTADVIDVIAGAASCGEHVELERRIGQWPRPGRSLVRVP